MPEANLPRRIPGLRGLTLEVVWAGAFLAATGLVLLSPHHRDATATLQIAMVAVSLLAGRLLQPRLVMVWLRQRARRRASGIARDAGAGAISVPPQAGAVFSTRALAYAAAGVACALLGLQLWLLLRPAQPVAANLSPQAQARVDALLHAIESRPQPPPQAGPATLDFDPAVREALLTLAQQALAHQVQPGQEGSRSTLPVGWIGLALGAGVVAVLVFALRKRADGAAAAGILTLAGSALAYASHVARVDPATFWKVVLVLAALSVLMDALCLVKIWRTPPAPESPGDHGSAASRSAPANGTPADGTPADGTAAGGPSAGAETATLPASGSGAANGPSAQEHHGWGVLLSLGRQLAALWKKEPRTPESPLVIALLPILLLFTFCVVAYGPGTPEPCKPVPCSGPQGPAPGVTDVSVAPLAERFNFPEGLPLRTAPSGSAPLDFSTQLGALQAAIGRLSPRPGDQIVLVGMADCKRFSGGNEALAKSRAEKVQALLAPYAERQKFSIVSLPMPQSESCKAQAEQRAVIPFFAHTSAASAAAQAR